MVKKSLVIVFFLISNIYADSFQNGNLEFSNKHYGNAEQEYKEELNVGGEDFNTLANLANTYLKQEKLGYALFYFYKARLISPREKNIKQSIFDIEEIMDCNGQYKNYYPLSKIENYNLTFIIVILISLLMITFSILKLYLKTNNIFYKLKRIILVILSILLIFTILGHILYFNDSISGIILEKTEAYLSPYSGSDSTFTALEGSKVEISETYEDFIFVTDQNQRYGWVEKNKLGELWRK